MEEKTNNGQQPTGGNASVENQGGAAVASAGANPLKQEEWEKQKQEYENKLKEKDGKMRMLQSQYDSRVAGLEGKVKQYESVMSSGEATAEEKAEAREKRAELRDELYELRVAQSEESQGDGFIGGVINDLGVKEGGEVDSLLKKVLSGVKGEEAENAKAFIGALVKGLQKDYEEDGEEEGGQSQDSPASLTKPGEGSQIKSGNESVEINRAAFSDPNATPEEKKKAREGMRSIFGSMTGLRDH